jgi:hypothetical protein
VHYYIFRLCRAASGAHLFLAEIREPAGSALFTLISFDSRIYMVRLVNCGTNWFVGMFGFVLYMSLLYQIVGYFSVPRIFARRSLDPATRMAEVETSANRIRISRGGNTSTIPRSKFTNIWLYDNFVILVHRPLLSLMQFVVLPADGMSSQMRLDLIAASQGGASRIT